MIFSPLDLITLGTFQIQINTTTYHQQYITILLYLKDFIDPHLKVIKYIYINYNEPHISRPQF